MLTIEGDYPISISLSSRDAIEAVSERYAASNVQLLRALNLLELGGHGGAPEMNIDAAGEIARIEAKLDIVLGMMGEWLLAQKQLPPLHHLWFSVDTLAVVVPEPMPEGETVFVELYTSSRVPRPLRFLCTVNRTTEEPERTIMELSIDRTNDSAADEFERYVFLLHRRQLSQHTWQEP